MNNSLHDDDILYTPDGEVYNPVSLDDNLLVISKFISCLMGMPLNLSVAVTIIRHPSLRCKPRNVFILGIVFSYFTCFIPGVIELIYWSFYPVESLCQCYVALMGVPRSLLLLNMLLALVDRYVAINHPMLHRRKMTARFASGLVIFSSILLVFSLKFVYIVGIYPLRCEVSLLHVKITLIVLVILFLFCIAFNCIVYWQTKNLLAQSRTIDPPTFESTVTNVGNGHRTRVDSMSVHVDRRKLCQMEVEAARTLIIGVTALCVVPCIGVLFGSSLLTCHFLFDQFECRKFVWMGAYIQELIVIPAVYGPLIFLVRNEELRTAVTRRTDH